MQPITDEQYREIAMAIRQTGYLNNTTKENLLAEGRTAVALSAPYLREQHYREALDLTEYDYDSELEDVIASWNWPLVAAGLTIEGVKQNIRDGICIWSSKRLRKLTAKPDPAIEAVKNALRDNQLILGSFLDKSETQVICERIVAAVRAADAAGGKQ